jgi:hypothetical protein
MYQLLHRYALALLIAGLLCGLMSRTTLAQPDPLPSWNDGAAKTAITGFVAQVTKDGGADFVPTAERIAVFDNDGTLWCEQPVYFRAAFALDSVKATTPISSIVCPPAVPGRPRSTPTGSSRPISSAASSCGRSPS